MNAHRDNFVRLAESRTNAVLKSIRLLGNLSNRSNYSYQEGDVKKIFSEINKCLKESRAKFESSYKHRDPGNFKL